MLMAARCGSLPIVLGVLAGCALPPPAPSGNLPPGLRQESDIQRRVNSRLEMAAEYYQDGKADIAEQEVRYALALDQNSADAWTLLAVIQMGQQQLAQAQNSLQRAMQLRPNDGDLEHNRGWVLCLQNQFDQAQQWFDKALNQPNYRQHPKTWMAKGICMQRAGDLERAEEMLHKAYELDTANPLYAYHLGNVMLLRGKAKDAQFHVRRINSGPASNAESLWLGLKIEREMQDSAAMRQLADTLGARFPESRQWQAYQQGRFDEQ